MAYAKPGRASRPQIDHCRYDGSRLLFRGPPRPLEGEFVACLGGTETFAREVALPFPDLLEELTGLTCVNFGWPNAGVEAFANDRALMGSAARARACVLQVPGAANLSNMYYRVHPRRNDRFLQPTEALQALYPEVDFMEFSFTRHLLGRLMALSPERFAYIREELATVWLASMRGLIGRIGAPVVLLWLSGRPPEARCDSPDPADDPAFVTRVMLEALRGEVAAVVELVLPREAGAGGFGPAQHAAVAEALVPALAGLLEP
ncbi:MAG: DUF6473 family protein [Roseovarius sp.]